MVPYQFAETIDYNEWQTMQYVFNNISSVTNIQFVPRYNALWQWPVPENVTKCQQEGKGHRLPFDYGGYEDLWLWLLLHRPG